MTERDIHTMAWSELTPAERRRVMDRRAEQRAVAAVAALPLNAPLDWESDRRGALPPNPLTMQGLAARKTPEDRGEA
jgi:hypothetical protein